MRFTLSPGRLGRDIDLPAGLLEHTLHHASPTSVYSAFDAEDAPARIPFCSQQGPPRNAALLPNQRGMPPLPPAFKKLDRQLEAVGIDLRGSLLCDRATWISSIISDLDYDLDDSCVHVHLIDGDCHSFPLSEDADGHHTQLQQSLEELVDGMQDAFLSIVIDDIDLDDLSKLAWSQTNRVTPKKSEDDDEQDGKKGPVPPPTPKQQLQELYHHARACLIDSYRRHVLPRLRHELPPTFLLWITQSSLSILEQRHERCAAIIARALATHALRAIPPYLQHWHCTLLRRLPNRSTTLEDDITLQAPRFIRREKRGSSPLRDELDYDSGDLDTQLSDEAEYEKELLMDKEMLAGRLAEIDCDAPSTDPNPLPPLAGVAQYFGHGDTPYLDNLGDDEEVVSMPPIGDKQLLRLLPQDHRPVISATLTRLRRQAAHLKRLYSAREAAEKEEEVYRRPQGAGKAKGFVHPVTTGRPKPVEDIRRVMETIRSLPTPAPTLLSLKRKRSTSTLGRRADATAIELPPSPSATDTPSPKRAPQPKRRRTSSKERIKAKRSATKPAKRLNPKTVQSPSTPSKLSVSNSSRQLVRSGACSTLSELSAFMHSHDVDDEADDVDVAPLSFGSTLFFASKMSGSDDPF